MYLFIYNHINSRLKDIAQRLIYIDQPVFLLKSASGAY